MDPEERIKEIEDLLYANFNICSAFSRNEARLLQSELRSLKVVSE